MSGAKVSGVDNVDYKGFSESTTRNPSKIEQNSDYISNSKSNPDGRSSSSDSLDNNSNAKGKTKSIPKGRIFQCTGYPECNMSFTRSEHLARHKRKHTGERPFTCLHCAKSFSRLDNLRQHQQTVHAYEKVAASNLQKDQVLAKGSSKPKTPSSAYFNVKDEGNHNDTNALLSPPNSSSPQHRHHLQTTQDSNGYPQVYQHSTTSLASPSYSINRSSTGSLQNHLIQTIPEFKPKRRPKPLSLAHSFLDDNREASSDSHSLNSVGGYLQSAPPIPTQSFHPSPYPTSSVLYVPKSASLTPKTSSPFSPLFHQSFKQINSKGIHVPSIPHNHRYESRYRGGMTYSNQLPKKSPKLPLSHLLNERDVDPGMNQGESDQK